MIDFHYASTANNLKIAIMMEETDLPYRLIKYDITEGTHLTREFRKLNPNSKLPVIVDHAPTDGGVSLSVFESGAILLYLAEKTGMLMPNDFRRRLLTKEWLIWQVSGLGPWHGQAHHFCRFAPEGQTYGIERYTREARRLLQVLNNRLREASYLVDEYSIADIACYPQTRRTSLIGIDLADYPAVSEWADRVKARPAVQRAIATIMDEGHGWYRRPRANLTPAQWSALFGDKYHSAPTD